MQWQPLESIILFYEEHKESIETHQNSTLNATESKSKSTRDLLESIWKSIWHSIGIHIESIRHPIQFIWNALESTHTWNLFMKFIGKRYGMH